MLVAALGLGAASAGGKTHLRAVKHHCKTAAKAHKGHKRRSKSCPKASPKVGSTKAVSLGLDSAHAASAPISARDGGTITTQTADGTTLVLTIPKNALAADTTVTMTPVSGVSGLPSGLHFLTGVQFAPEGTALFQDATLTIESPRAASLKKLHALAWEGAGTSPFTYDVQKNGSTLVVTIAHFSGAGVENGPGLSYAAIEAAQQAAYPALKQEMLQATSTDSPDVSAAALGDFFRWERTNQLLLDQSFMASQRAALQSLIPAIVQNAIEKSYERCKSQHDVFKEYTYLVGAARVAALLVDSDMSNVALGDSTKCATFRVDFHSVLHSDLPGGSFDYQVVAQVPVTISANGTLTGSGDLNYAMTGGQLVKTDPCPVGGGSITQTTTIVGTTPSVLTVSNIETPDLTGASPSFRVHIDVGAPTETYDDNGVATGGCTSSDYQFTQPFWKNDWVATHAIADQGPFSGFVVPYNASGSATLGHQTFPASTSGVTDQTTIDIVHTPQ